MINIGTHGSKKMCNKTILMNCSLELAEDVGVLGRDAGGLQDGDSEGEGAADLQVRQSFLRGEVQRKIQTQACTLGWALGSFDGFMEEKKI